MGSARRNENVFVAVNKLWITILDIPRGAVTDGRQGANLRECYIELIDETGPIIQMLGALRSMSIAA